MCRIEPGQYRKTFLRHHVERVRGFRVGCDHWAEEVEALRDLEALNAAPDRLTLDWFLFGDGAGGSRPLYLPVPLKPDGPGPEHRVSDLVELIRTEFRAAPGSPRRWRGVLVEGPGGSGKTVSLYRAFFACFRPGPSEASPPLAGFIPCLIDHIPDRNCASWEGLIAGIASEGLGTRFSSDQVSSWVEHSPPLLLLCDLDNIPIARRQAVVRWLNRFCEEESRGRHRRSCCVIAGSALDPSLRLPRQDRRFARYRPEPWTTASALSYAACWRSAVSQWAPGPEGPSIEALIGKRERLPGFVQQTLVLSNLPKGPLTEGVLVNAWVDSRRELLESQAVKFSDLTEVGGQEIDGLILALTTRLALPLYHEDDVREELSGDEAANLIRAPAWPDAPWHPSGHADWPWTEPSEGDYCPYFRNPPSPGRNMASELFELVRVRSPFLRGRGRCIRFVGELSDYFEGVMATRFWKRPFQPPLSARVLDAGWHSAVLRRWERHHERFTQAALLLGGVLTAEDLRRLLGCYLRRLGGRGDRQPVPVPVPDLPRLLPLLAAVLEGWQPEDHEDGFLRAAHQKLRDLWQRDVREEEVFSQLHEWFRPSDEFMAEFRRLAGQEDRTWGRG
jgi:hypothetical protein